MSLIRFFAGTFTPSRAEAAKFFGQRRFDLLRAEDAVVAGTGNGNADPILALGHEHADDRIARSRIAELLVGRLGRRGEGHGSDDLAVLQRGLEQALEEFIGRNLALVGDDGRAQRQQCRRIVGRRVVVGDRTANRALVADGRVADQRARWASAGQAFLSFSSLATS